MSQALRTGPVPEPRSAARPRRVLVLAIALTLAAFGLAFATGPRGTPQGSPAERTAMEPVSIVRGTSGLPNTWLNLSPPTAPSPRESPLLAFDSRTGQVILFGGFRLSGMLNDTWAYDPVANRWTNLTTATHPSIACTWCFATAGMVYDSGADRVILFGGTTGPDNNANETWAYDVTGNTWTQMHPTDFPWFNHDFSMAYDSAADRVLYFGGATITPDMYYVGTNATWSYDYTNDSWTLLGPATPPSARFGASMAYDARTDRTLLFGGCTNGYELWPSCAMANDTWSYDYGSNTWTNVSGTTAPPPAVALPMVYDNGSDRLVLFGQGWATGNQTWTYDAAANSWATQHPPGSPSGRGYPGMVYDSIDNETILFGGRGATFLNDTWAYKYGLAVPSVPSAPVGLRASMRLTYSGEYVDLDWKTPADDGGYTITGYRVYRGTASGAESFLAYATGLSYSDWFGTQGAVFYYEVTAVNTLGEGPPSNEVNSTPTIPGPPSHVQVAVGTAAGTWNQANLTWYAPTDGGSALAGYLVYRGTSSGGESFLSSAGLNPWYLDTGLAANTTYYYQVAAVNGVGTGPRSGEVNATAKPPPPPPDYEPPNVVITFPTWGAVLNTTVITVRGTASDNVAVARVEVSVNNGSSVLADGTTSWSLTVTLQQGANSISVTAYDTSGNGWGTGVNVTVRTQSTTQGGGSSGGGGNGTASPVGIPIAAWYGAVAATALIVAVVAALLWSDRRKRRANPPP